MAVSGVVLFLFAIGHLIGNLQVFLGPYSINRYGAFLQGPMKEFLWPIRLVMLTLVVLHIWSASRLTLENRAARPVGYNVWNPTAATFASRTMFLGGLAIAFFIIYHLLHYTVLAQVGGANFAESAGFVYNLDGKEVHAGSNAWGEWRGLGNCLFICFFHKSLRRLSSPQTFWKSGRDGVLFQFTPYQEVFNRLSKELLHGYLALIGGVVCRSSLCPRQSDCLRGSFVEWVSGLELGNPQFDKLGNSSLWHVFHQCESEILGGCFPGAFGHGLSRILPMVVANSEWIPSQPL